MASHRAVTPVTESRRFSLRRPMAKSRLDALLVDRGLFESRSRAAAAVIAGDVQLGDDGRRADKPGQMVAPDVAASTGGFTDCLLQRGAARVIAVDVAYGELHWKIRNEPGVTVLERVNARSLAPGDLPYAPDLIVADVSFVSLRKALPAPIACAGDAWDCLAMVKPQFEVGRERVGKGGVVRSAEDRREALVGFAGWARESIGAV